MHKPTLVAVDTNFPVLLAKGDDDAQEALQVVRRRLRPVQIIIPPTVAEELARHAENDRDPVLSRLALTALQRLETKWRFLPASLTSVQEAIVEEAVRRLRHSGLVPYPERNDAAVIAESAVLYSVLLVSNDSHLLAVDHRRLGLLFRELDLPVPLIISPREVVKKFYR